MMGAAVMRAAVPLVIGAALTWWGAPRSPYMALPNPELTPGAVIMDVTAADVCAPGYARQARYPNTRQGWSRLKRQIMRLYGYGDRPASDFELDDLVPIELGGASDAYNRWPQPIAEARIKDADENLMHDAVCAGRISLQDAQRYFLEGDWAK